jgi:uncharacterized protein YcbK (DUF882 family)
MTVKDNGTTSRRALIGAFAGIAMVSAAPSYAGLFSYNKGAGNIRRVRLRSSRTGESLDTIYWIDGEYINPALEEINFFMRDWREDAVVKMDRRNIDLIAASHNLLEANEPFLMLSGYRTPRTNAMLRRRSRSVAKGSYHVKAMAADVRLKSRTVNQIASAALSTRAGGVGRYHRSNFVHMDSGPIRTWRR